MSPMSGVGDCCSRASYVTASSGEPHRTERSSGSACSSRVRPTRAARRLARHLELLPRPPPQPPARAGLRRLSFDVEALQTKAGRWVDDGAVAEWTLEIVSEKRRHRRE